MPIIRQSGAIVVRLDGSKPKVLLVTAKRNPENWIFPKGHIEKGETAESAAVRETMEEAGVGGKVMGPAGVLMYAFLGAKVRVEYFLLEFAGEVGPPERGRARAWYGLEEALERLRYKNTKKLLQKAWRLLPEVRRHIW